MRKHILSVIYGSLFLVSCATYGVKDYNLSNDVNYGQACPNPAYVATLFLQPQALVDSYGNSIINSNYTLEDCLKEAKTKYGDEVTIMNVRWDMKNGKKRKSAIFDVIKCK
jgi:hypothetical protein